MKRNYNGDGSLHLRKDGIWQFDIMINGKRKSYYGSTREEALQKANYSPAQSASTAAVSMTLDDWFNTWINTFVQTKDSTKKKYMRDYRLYVKPYIGNIQIKNLSTLDVQTTYIKNMNEKNLSPKSIYNVHGVLSSMMKKAAKLGYVDQNVVANCELPKIRKAEMHPLLDKDTGSFLNAAKSDKFYKEFFVAMFTGMRESQLIGLTWDCIDFEKQTIRIYRQYVKTGSKDGKGVFEFTSLKNGKERTIVVPTQVLDMLSQIKKEQEKYKNSLSYHNPTGFVFTDKKGEHIQYHTLYCHFKKLAASIGRPESRFHDLRHTYATLSIQNGSDIKTVSSNLGHATVAFTMDRYGHVSDAMKKDSAARMQNMIEQYSRLQQQKANKKAQDSHEQGA